MPNFKEKYRADLQEPKFNVGCHVYRAFTMDGKFFVEKTLIYRVIVDDYIHDVAVLDYHGGVEYSNNNGKQHYERSITYYIMGQTVPCGDALFLTEKEAKQFIENAYFKIKSVLPRKK